MVRGGPAIVPNNRALAVNAACTSCRATGAAFQVVVSSGPDYRLSRGSLAALRAWVAEQAAALRSPAATPEAPATGGVGRQKAERRAQRAAGAALVDLEDLVTADLGATTVSSDVELSR